MQFAILLAALAAATAGAARLTNTYDLPMIEVTSSQEYLVKGTVTVLRCGVSPGWSHGGLEKIVWLLQGTRIDVDETSDYSLDEHSALSIHNFRHKVEGEYQCQGKLKQITISNGMIVDVDLISAPLNLRKTRIGKFESAKEVFLFARPGSVIRLPCPGLPDVIPSPPQIYFEREQHNATVGLDTGAKVGDSRFFSSHTGMQIAMVQRGDAGKYRCVVKNTFTQAESRAEVLVDLKVIGNGEPGSERMSPDRMEVSWPAGRMSSRERPYQLEVVADTTILMECIINNAKITWTKENHTLYVGAHGSDAHARQVFGNLQIRKVEMYDAGIYVCKGHSHFNPAEEVSVYYELIVHQPSDVRLYLTQRLDGHSWEISCLAQNLRYEIPMVFVNTTPLIDAMESMGVPKDSNFYTNPINVTLEKRNNFTGTVQCISRPAMEEAEIYGSGLERGRSKNYYVLNDGKNSKAIRKGPANLTIIENDEAKMVCEVNRASKRQWKKDGRDVVLIHGRTKLLPSNALFITNATRADEGWYACVVTDETGVSTEQAYLSVIPRAAVQPTLDAIPKSLAPKARLLPARISRVSGMVVGIDVRLQWTVDDPDNYKTVATFMIQNKKDGDLKWTDVGTAAGHTRSTTVRELQHLTKYKFRVLAVFEDKTASGGTESDWIETLLPMVLTRPPPPIITVAEPVSSQSIHIEWTHAAPHNFSRAAHFVVYYSKESQPQESLRVDGATRNSTIKGLSENATYAVFVRAENAAGASEQSKAVAVKTMHPNDERPGLLTLLWKGLVAMAPGNEDQKVQVVVLVCIVVLVLSLACCACCCRGRGDKGTGQQGGGAHKFIDTSYSIYNQQKVHRNKLAEPYDPKEFFGREISDEHLPLRGNNNLQNEDRISLNSRSSRRFRLAGARPFPNLYGRGEESEEEAADADPLAPLESHYGWRHPSGGGILSYGPPATSSSARCFSAETGACQEVLVPPPPLLLSNGGLPLYHPPSRHSPLPAIPPLINTTCSPLKSTASVSYKTGGDTALIAYSPASLAESGGSGSGQTRTTNADSPTHPLTDGSENGGHRGDSSRNSQISSVDGRFQPLASFKSGSALPPPLMSTFAR